MKQEAEVLEVKKPGKPRGGLGRTGQGTKIGSLLRGREGQVRRLMLLVVVEGDGDLNGGEPTEVRRHGGGLCNDKGPHTLMWLHPRRVNPREEKKRTESVKG